MSVPCRCGRIYPVPPATPLMTLQMAASWLHSSLTCRQRIMLTPLIGAGILSSSGHSLRMFADLTVTRGDDNRTLVCCWSVLQFTTRCRARVLAPVFTPLQEELQTVVLMELPIISAICRDPASGKGNRLAVVPPSALHFTESGLASLKKFLQLILGCCVQCAKRESYINHIKSMSSDNQIEMMQEIQSVRPDILRFECGC